MGRSDRNLHRMCRDLLRRPAQRNGAPDDRFRSLARLQSAGGTRSLTEFGVIDFEQAIRMKSGVGKKVWVIPEGYIPKTSHGPDPELTSHEAVCVLNTNPQQAQVEITLFFEEREPVGPYRISIPGRRVSHIRFNHLENPAPVPKGVPYASLIEADVPVVVQHTRLDSRQAENALMTTIAFPGNE